MGSFGHRGFTRRRLGERTPPPLRPLLGVLMLASLALMLLSRLDYPLISQARAKATAVLTPVLSVAVVPIDALKSFGRRLGTVLDQPAEIARLRAENQRLQSWQWRAQEAERKKADLERLAQVVKHQELKFVTGQVVANSSSAFVRSVLINAGIDQQLRVGYPAINGDGLVGRIVELGSSSGNVMLLNDAASRVPVVVGHARIRAVMAGDNGPNPLLVYVPAGAKIAPGDAVATSGVGGVFPPGLQIGTVRGDPRRWTVRVKAELDNLEYLSVLFFENPILDILKPTPSAELLGLVPATATRSAYGGTGQGPKGQTVPR